jgi:hypothetical protein
VSTAAEETPTRQREWWLRALVVFQSPMPIFAAIRDDSNEAAQARQEPILAIVLLAGMAGVLSTTVAGRLLDPDDVDAVIVAVWTFLGGAIYAAFVYWLGGLLLHGAGAILGSTGTYRRARHVLGFAAAPLALSLLLVWPVRLAVYGGDVFRSGGDDTGAGDALFEALALGFGLWAVALVVSGTRAVNGWPWPRALACVALAVSPVALLFGLSLL